MTHYDLIIIGAGSGNSIPTPEHDDISIAIIEKDKFGGTCMNVGCIPTKMYVYAADVAHQTSHSQKLGITGEVTNVDWDSIVDRVFTNRIDKIAEGGEAYRRGDETPNITVYDQHAEFIGPKTIKTGDDVITGDEIVIATGSRPQIPSAIANSGATYHTNETIMRLPQQPKSLAIIGGGFIAMEFAHVFEGLGTDVTIINRSETLLRWLDKDLSSRFNTQARDRYNVITNVNVQDVENTANGGVKISLDNDSVLEADALLVATGRIPNGDQMNLESAGIEMHEDGRIKVDDFGRTTAEGVWALGDVSSPYMLKHVANAETKAVRQNMLHPDDMVPMPHDHVPSAIFTHPQIATVGLTEEEARAQNLDITVKVQNYSDVAYGWAMEDHDGICKLIADKKSGKLLGAHFYGPQASTLIQQMITVMAFDLDVRDFAQKQYWIHPALPEVTENALLGLEFDSE
ncbi:MAG: mycothione reductase [Corynebacterium casei]|uniref:Dihydrolipoyl dehydrogenase n=2 Tax=Corynebacterium casei TaxID=160386 RepID=G7HVF0_9CORY|nr:mycothione reductase [Corynebacterium casei]AHI19800.1 mycothione reductase [Corynebacterium casei LMG S-19264]MDN5799269.1 mycothione reductase [Corynebacterium casei]MDN5826155.1 mycothione reductase [Corynebacterium casei]MDN5921535.1 mycothione reductase [Corynebacterium casei]MDN6262529.1 mycothione reductase [Corynebacterium casei]